VFGSAVAGGRVRATASHLRPNQFVYKNGCPLSRLSHTEKLPLTAGGIASREQDLSAGKRANFSAAKNLPFCTSKTKEIHKIFKGRESYYMIHIVIIIVNTKCYL
jgi:hypothetical protein